MAGDSDRPLTPTEAKERFRAAAERVSLHSWVQDSPWSFLLLVLSGGYLAGSVPAARTAMIWSLTRTLTALLEPAKKAGKSYIAGTRAGSR